MGDVRRQVVVLEDARDRIEWLSEEFPGVDVVWAETVTGFFDALRQVDPSRLSLFVLDHDLGMSGPTWPLDANGNSGMHAVDMLSQAWSGVPAIVWSINSPRAQEMVLRLRDKGFIAVWVPHLDGHKQRLRATIASQVEEG